MTLGLVSGHSRNQLRRGAWRVPPRKDQNPDYATARALRPELPAEVDPPRRDLDDLAVQAVIAGVEELGVKLAHPAFPALRWPWLVWTLDNGLDAASILKGDMYALPMLTINRALEADPDELVTSVLHECAHLAEDPAADPEDNELRAEAFAKALAPRVLAEWRRRTAVHRFPISSDPAADWREPGLRDGRLLPPPTVHHVDW